MFIKEMISCNRGK